MDNNLLTGTICEPSLLAHIIVHKMQFGLPLYLYRLEQKLVFPDNQNISRQLMSAWSITTYNKLKGLEAAFERALYKSTMWNIDETSLLNIHSNKKSKVQLQYDRDILTIQEDGNKQKLSDESIISMVKERYEQYKKDSHNTMNCFMIVRSATNKDGSRGLVMFNYTEHRTNEYLGSFIGDYNGVLQSDGLAGYSNAAKDKSFVHLGCLIHYPRSIIIQENLLNVS
ncbi:MAG: transposase [Spirochaetaceae bacterium]|nr:transposase [Spirochaetaceae bacterium]